MFKKKRALTTAVLLSCLCLMAPYYAHAEQNSSNEDTSSVVHTQRFWELDVNGSAFAKFDMYDAISDPGGYEVIDEERLKYRKLFDGEEQAIGTGMKYIADMVGSPANTLNMNLKLFEPQDANASAVSNTWIKYDNNGVPIQISDTELTATYLGKKSYDENEGVAEITVNMADKWYTKKFPVLPSNETDSDYYGTITHEMFHALGLGTYIYTEEEGNDKKVCFGTKAEYGNENEPKTIAVFNKYEMGLRDAFGRVAYYSDDKTYDDNPLNPNDENDWNRISGELKSRQIVPITVAEYMAMLNETKDNDKFYVLRDSAPVENPPSGGDGAPRLSHSCSSGYSEIGTKGGAYFTGKNVAEVLTTNGEIAQIAWPDDSLTPAVPGLPVNGYEDSEDDEPELSHIELQNSLMSHQSYRNWCTFMEAEIALLQDLGYTIDRSKYFGKSIYNSGTNNKLFEVNNNIGFNSTQTHGIGLHVYGSYVDVTQNAALHADGDYGIGIRVDGVGNKLTINSDVSANGEGGNGLLVAYGKKHNITLNAGNTIEAMGKDGVAARFDFGSNELGDKVEYRGSYIDIGIKDENKNDVFDEDEKWEEKVLPDAINGELVRDFNVSGTLKGSYAAIYISPNALVKNINILNGANIQGDIISDWNPKEIIYQNENSSKILAPAEDPDALLTELRFGAKFKDDQLNGADDSFNMTYKGNIKGTDSINMNVFGGKLEYHGDAEVKDFIISRGATLSGKGTYKIGPEGDRGTFTNSGTFDLGEGIAEIKITGNYVQIDTNARLLVDFNSDGESDKLIVSEGKATISGAVVRLTPQVDYYFNGQKIKLSPIIDGTIESTYIETPIINNISPVLNFKVAENDTRIGESGEIVTVSGSETAECDYAKTQYIITVEREQNGYQSVATDDISSGISNAIDSDSQKQQNITTEDKQALIKALDYSAITAKTEVEKKNMMGSAIKKLNPNVAGSSAQATLVTNTALNNVTMMNTFRTTKSTAPIKLRSGRGPRREEEEQPKYNSWRNSVMPFAAYTNQHNGSSGYTNHNSGVIGAIERTLENGLTHGYHAAINHQSTQDSGSTIKGEGIYVGSQAAYAPAAWKGWEIFGSARLGVEQMRSRRSVYIGGGAPYYGTADANWTGYSGSLNIGTGYTMEHGVLRSGPFASLEYSFAHRPSVHEKGGAIRTDLESATYDSLRTQLGYRLTTKPKRLDSYDNTQWQAHASVAWNHELTSDNGRSSYELAEFPGTPIEDTIETYGRDSLSIAAGITFKTPKRLDVDLTLGSDIYRKGGSSVYGQVKFEWKI